ncbi:HNH endonuclease [Enterobacter hormaechei subsp. steigerwaltii]|uniref:HNH endonuclease n=1 Tax=Enterobacter hormaechei TaxID=158836 RepID=UPI003F4434C4
MKNRILPSREYLRTIFKFDEKDGSLIWKKREPNEFSSLRACNAWNSKMAGKKAGYGNRFRSKKYLVVGINGEQFLAHRLIFKIIHNSEPENVDHMDGNGLNNKPANLRGTDSAGNHLNVMMSERNTSGVVGVSLHRKSNLWRARITQGNVSKSLGYFPDFDLAVAARKKAELELGFHKNHGAKNSHE